MMWEWMCGQCPGSELIHGGDQDQVDQDGVVSDFTCPTCDVYVEVSHG